jgi:hypothetical protein
MERIVVLGQPGAFGSAWCDRAASLLAQRLDLPRIDTVEAVPKNRAGSQLQQPARFRALFCVPRILPSGCTFPRWAWRKLGRAACASGYV